MSDLASPAGLTLAPDTRPRAEAAAVVWRWRRAADPVASRREAAAERRRGLVGGAVGALVALLLWQWRPAMALVVLAVAVLLASLAVLSPLGAFRLVRRALERFGHAVGVGLTWVLMAIVYYGLFLPVGLLLRARGRLRLRKALDPAAPTYWTKPPERPLGLDRYRRQF